MNIQDEILTLNEAADFLKLHADTVLKYWRTGLIPGRKIGKQYRFSRSDLVGFVNGSTVPAVG